jgi:Ca-activated chloride channel family protein
MPSLPTTARRVLTAVALLALAAAPLGACSYAGGRAPSPSAMAYAPPPMQSDTSASGESYAHVAENPFRDAAREKLSTFSVDVDTASYANVRRILRTNALPPADAVRVEEMVNYFGYDYAGPKGDDPVAVAFDAMECPWNREHQLVRIGLKARDVDLANAAPKNLVFLLDVSGSMSPANRLPMILRGMRMLVERMRPEDSVAIVVYAGASGLALPPTHGDRKGDIFAALDRLEAGGSTNGAEGIRLAYQTARSAFRQGGVNRVILATDGDFNVGVTSQGDLLKLIEEERKSGVFLSVLGVGEGNLKDSTMEMLADHGNGNYAYLDSLNEARRVLVEQAGSTLVAVAKDVKVQVEWNPEKVASYRLVGYENRVLDARDFKDDAKDAGDMGAGHTVTALFEVAPRAAAAGVAKPASPVASTKPVAGAKPAPVVAGGEWMTVRVRFKEPAGSTSREIAAPFVPSGGAPSADTRLAAAVADFGLLLKKSEHRGSATYAQVLALLDDVDRAGKPDAGGVRAELRELTERARKLAGEGAAAVAR